MNFWFCLILLCLLAIWLVRSQPMPPDDEVEDE
jgi:hypothetical protein